MEGEAGYEDARVEAGADDGEEEEEMTAEEMAREEARIMREERDKLSQQKEAMLRNQV